MKVLLVLACVVCAMASNGEKVRVVDSPNQAQQQPEIVPDKAFYYTPPGGYQQGNVYHGSNGLNYPPPEYYNRGPYGQRSGNLPSGGPTNSNYQGQLRDFAPTPQQRNPNLSSFARGGR